MDKSKFQESMGKTGNQFYGIIALLEFILVMHSRRIEGRSPKDHQRINIGSPKDQHRTTRGL